MNCSSELILRALEALLYVDVTGKTVLGQSSSKAFEQQ